MRVTSELIRPGRVLLIGELHGTYEFPSLVAGVAGNVARNGHDILIGLERSPDPSRAASTSFSSVRAHPIQLYR